jgi:DNA (cytosine-5)-methyltransferase 1
MTQYEAWPDEPINLLVGGTPCQSFSVAGLRKGLADPRGNLMLTYGAIAKRYRPEWLVWENVPGVLSSNGGRDFGTFLGMLAELGYGFAYRVLDAQYFGVAQRRRRVFVIGHLGSWQRAAAVLFERHSLQGHPAPSREKGQGTAAHVEGGVELCGPLNARDYKDPGTDGMNRNSAKMVPVAIQATIIGRDENSGPNGVGADTSGAMFTLTKADVHGVAQPIPYDFFQITAPINRQSREPGDPCHTLARDNAAHATIVQPTYGIPGNWIGRQPENGGNAVEPMHDVSPCLTKTDRHGVAQPYVGGVDYENNAHTMDEPTGPLLKGSPTGGGRPLPAIATAMQVRRLTPVECERLQGFPDGYTNIPWRNKTESPDGLRYKAMGNSMAVPVMRWIGERIAAVEAL